MLSIIIPVYNKEEYIAQTLDSILGVSDAEIVIVDDRSTDQSLSICKAYQKKCDHIRIIEGEHKGVSAARNIGLQNANGDYCCFLDADDLYVGEKLADVADTARRQNADILLFDFEKFCPTSTETVTLSANEGIVNAEDKNHFLAGALRVFSAHNVSNKLYASSFIQKNGLRFREDISRFEDVCFFIGALTQAERVYYQKQTVHRYRVNIEGSLVNKKHADARYLFFYMDTLNGFVKRLNGTGSMNAEMKDVYLSALNHELAVLARNMDSADYRALLETLKRMWNRNTTAVSENGIKYALRVFTPKLAPKVLHH